MDLISSVAIADTEKMRHDQVLAIIRRMQNRGIVCPTEASRFHRGKTTPVFMLDAMDAQQVLSRIRRPRFDAPLELGQRFGRWVVLNPIPIHAGKQVNIRCLCDCGTEKDVNRVRMMTGKSLSCGCLARELSSKRGTTHGWAYSTEYGIWSKIIARCENPNHPAYKYYGARGVRVCQEWKESFESFIRDMGPRPSLGHSVDRFPNNTGDYEPSNCRWATWEEQNNNKPNNHILEFSGQIKTVSQWAREFGLTHGTLSRRLRSGWEVADALTIPVNSITDLRNGGYKNMKRGQAQ